MHDAAELFSALSAQVSYAAERRAKRQRSLAFVDGAARTSAASRDHGARFAVRGASGEGSPATPKVGSSAYGAKVPPSRSKTSKTPPKLRSMNASSAPW